MAAINLQTQPDQTILKPVTAPEIPPLEHGDHLTRDEFERRYEAMPEVKKAELIEGRVYLPLQVCLKSRGDLPPLEQGDYLSGEEFERRYEAMPELKKAELINGRVYMSSPVRFDRHSEQHGWFAIWLGIYSVSTPGVRMGDNATVRMDENEYPQPDVTLMIDTPPGSESLLGSSYIGADGYLRGAPELVAEVAASSASYDLSEKKEAYRRNGVQEYIVWQIYDWRVDWFGLEANQYAPLSPDENGIIRSRVVPGLWLDVTALLENDMAKVLSVLQQGLASPEHGEFIKRLGTAKRWQSL